MSTVDLNLGLQPTTNRQDISIGNESISIAGSALDVYLVSPLEVFAREC